MKRNQSTAHLRHFSSILRLSFAVGAVRVFASIGSAAGTSKDTYYVNDHLASTVATADAAGEIAQIESDAFGTQSGPVAKDSRFTGKPYDADMGAYVFPFRNYRSDEARWMSADPSGFPDGGNNSAYKPNPNMQFDALGLVTSTIGDFVITATSGASSSTADSHFTESETTAAFIPTSGPGAVSSGQVGGGSGTTFGSITGSDGWIVQHVISKLNGTATMEGYEAIQVHTSGGSVHVYNADGELSTVVDTFGINYSPTPDSSGNIINQGWAKYFTNDVAGSTISSWTVNATGASPAMLSSTTAPTWFGSGGEYHWLKVAWTPKE